MDKITRKCGHCENLHTFEYTDIKRVNGYTCISLFDENYISPREYCETYGTVFVDYQSRNFEGQIDDEVKRAPDQSFASYVKEDIISNEVWERDIQPVVDSWLAELGDESDDDEIEAFELKQVDEWIEDNLLVQTLLVNTCGGNGPITVNIRDGYSEADGREILFGYNYALKSTAESEFGSKGRVPNPGVTAKEAVAKALACMRSEVETWNDYQTGQVFGYMIIEGARVVYSCAGYYGDDKPALNDAISEAKGMDKGREIDDNGTLAPLAERGAGIEPSES